MFSIFLKQVVPACITKTEEFIFRPRVILQRAICTTNPLTSRAIQNPAQDVSLTTHGTDLSNDPVDFGKVVEFNLEEFEKEDVSNQTGRKKRGRKKGIKADKKESDNSESGLNEGSEENVKEVKKKKFQDLRRKNSDTFSALMTNLKSKRGREKMQRIYLEGKRLIHDAIKAGYTPLKIYFSRPSDLDKLNLPEGVEVFRLPYDKLQFWSDVVTSQGIIGIFEMPDSRVLNTKNENSIPLTVVCDNVREPSNLGSILRVVASVGCEKLILTKGCVDLWEPKVLRSAAGAHFHLPVLKGVTWDKIENEIPEDHKVVLASCAFQEEENENSCTNLTETQSSVFTTASKLSKCLPLKCYSDVDYRNQSTAIIIGGETAGLSSDAIKFAIERKGLRVYIPMSNQIESLNSSVALGIFSYMVRYQYESSVSASQAGQENDKSDLEVD